LPRPARSNSRCASVDSSLFGQLTCDRHPVKAVSTDDDDKLFGTASVYAKADDFEENEPANGVDELVELLAVVNEKILTVAGWCNVWT
jgi:hypothetical protein